MLQLENITFGYGERPILQGFDLAVADGQVVALRGESGCGKTTAARLLLGLEQPRAGTVTAPEKISAVFQENRLVENRSVQRNLFSVLPRGVRPGEEQLQQLLRECGLENLAHRRVSALSGGQKRRVALLRAILYDGDALILDEPFNGLDADSKLCCSQMIGRYFTQKGKPVLLITHMTEDALLLGAQIVQMTRTGE